MRMLENLLVGVKVCTLLDVGRCTARLLNVHSTCTDSEVCVQYDDEQSGDHVPQPAVGATLHAQEGAGAPGPEGGQHSAGVGW